MEARRSLRALEYRSDVRLSSDQVYNLILNATGNKDIAEKACKDYIADQLRKGMTPL